MRTLTRQARTAAGVDDASLGQKLTKALIKLGPSIQQAIAMHPGKGKELTQVVEHVKNLLKASDFDKAKTAILQLDSVVKALLATKATSPGDLVSIWRNAKDSVDVQLERFRSAMIKTGDAYLNKVASGRMELLLYGTKKEYVSMQVALLDLQSAQGEARKSKAQSLLKTIESYREYVGKNRFIVVCDSNKLCGPLTIGETLKAALDQLQNRTANLAA